MSLYKMHCVLVFITVPILFASVYGVPPLLKKRNQDIMKLYASELATGDPSEVMGTNPHYHQPLSYKDFGRRFVPQYPYIEVHDTKNTKSEEGDIIPELAPPEVVLNIARQSVILEKSKPQSSTEEIATDNILRSGNYWNGVWKEDANQERILRSSKKSPVLNSVKVKVMPGSELFELVSRLKKVSPRLLYIINKKKHH